MPDPAHTLRTVLQHTRMQHEINNTQQPPSRPNPKLKGTLPQQWHNSMPTANPAHINKLACQRESSTTLLTTYHTINYR
jgi:hypothetical protein